MCGIAGWIDWERDLSTQGKIIKKMTSVMAHRGPDAEGFYLSRHVVLGHRRLVVMDPGGGHQPMTRKSKEGHNFTISYNGELYNTLELRQELAKRGYSFLTDNSDTEVLLLAYIEWKEACLERLNGIFALAIWDQYGQKLFLARDRLGVKPLFYCHQGDSFMFASEIKGLLVHPKVEPIIDGEGMAEVLVMGPSRTPGHGVFRGIQELRPGYYITLDRQNLRQRKYWSLESRPHEETIDVTASHLRELFIDSVRRQVLADVPICTLLSGGLDSSAITAVAARLFRQSGQGALPTFSVDYIGNEEHFQPNLFQPDADAAVLASVSAALGTEHRYIKLDNKELADTLEAAMIASDLPGMADIDSSLYLFCREVKQQATVALSGECADEILGGYPWFRIEMGQPSGTFPWIRSLATRMKLLRPEVLSRIRPQDYIGDRYQQARAEVPRLPGEGLREARLRELFYLNITRFMPTLLDRKDRMSMANGLEVRVPFGDHRLVEYVWNIPWEIKNCDHQAKGILRRALAGILPEQVINRAKSPYPRTHHPQYPAIVKARVKRMLDERQSPLLEIVNPAALRQFLESPEDLMPLPWFGQLMGQAQYLAYLLQLNSWFKEYRVRLI